MADTQKIAATSEGHAHEFLIDWDANEWTSTSKPDEAMFPFVAEVDGKRYELYSDGTMDEEEVEEKE